MHGKTLKFTFKEFR